MIRVVIVNHKSCSYHALRVSYNLQPDCCSDFLLANLVVYIQDNLYYCKHVFVLF